MGSTTSAAGKIFSAALERLLFIYTKWMRAIRINSELTKI